MAECKNTWTSGGTNKLHFRLIIQDKWSSFKGLPNEMCKQFKLSKIHRRKMFQQRKQCFEASARKIQFIPGLNLNYSLFQLLCWFTIVLLLMDRIGYCCCTLQFESGAGFPTLCGRNILNVFKQCVETINCCTSGGQGAEPQPSGNTQ